MGCLKMLHRALVPYRLQSYFKLHTTKVCNEHQGIFIDLSTDILTVIQGYCLLEVVYFIYHGVLSFSEQICLTTIHGQSILSRISKRYRSTSVFLQNEHFCVCALLQICEYQGHPSVNWKNSNVGQLSQI